MCKINWKWLAALSMALLLLTACQEGPSNKLEEWAFTQAAKGVNAFAETFGGAVVNGLDSLKNADHKGGPFENDIDSARAYLLERLREKYGKEFTVVGNEKLQNYGLFAGASYSCRVVPVDAPEQTADALVSQTLYQDVRDDYAVYYFKEEAEAPVQALCETKDYVLDQIISLEMPETPRTWTPEDGLDRYLTGSGAYVRLVLRFPDGLDVEAYAEYLYDFLHSVDQLDCDLSLQVKANKHYLFFAKLPVREGLDLDKYTLEYLRDEIEEETSMPSPQ